MATSKSSFLSKWKGLISMPTFTKFVAFAQVLSGTADYMLGCALIEYVFIVHSHIHLWSCSWT